MTPYRSDEDISKHLRENPHLRCVLSDLIFGSASDIRQLIELGLVERLEHSHGIILQLTEKGKRILWF
jgi:hypothetical protein